MATIQHLITTRKKAFAASLEVLASTADEDYIRHALLADSLSTDPDLLANTTAVVSTDIEADIVSIRNRIGGGTVDELRGVLSIDKTAETVETVKKWKSKVDKTRTAVGVELRSLGFTDTIIGKITAQDGESLFFSTDSMVKALEALDPFADRTTTINGEAYVLIG
jgi:hypothetical protein